MGLAIQLHRGEYKNLDAIENVIRYITRTRPNETNHKDLILWGDSSGFQYNKSPEEEIAAYKFVSKIYNQRGSKICHYCLHILPSQFQCMNQDYHVLASYAVECCQYLFHQGYQTCFAIHLQNDLHIHFAINTTNYMTGYKLSQYLVRVYNNIETPFLNILQTYLHQPQTFDSFD